MNTLLDFLALVVIFAIAFSGIIGGTLALAMGVKWLLT